MTRARDAACHCGSGRKLKRLLVNHELGRRKSFWVDESLSYMLATTDLDALGRYVRAPFPAFALVFTDRLALSLGERLLSPDTSCNGAGQLLRVTTVYVTEIGADDRRELELCFAFDTAGADPPHLVRHTIALSDDAPVVAHLEGLSPRVVAEPAVADASPRRGLLQLAVNAILYATSAGVTPELRAPPPRPRRAPQRQPAATAPKGATSSSDSWFAVTGVAPRRAATSGCGGLRRTGRGRTWRRSSSARTGCGRRADPTTGPIAGERVVSSNKSPRTRMASALPAQPPASGSPPFPIARFSVDQYHRMIQSGAFTEDDRFELIEGWVVTKMAKGPAHEYVTGRADEILRELVPRGWHVRNQAPITLGDSEPEPDLSIARGERGAFRDRHPGASDVALVVEVSDTTLATDRLKARVYAASGIAEYWIVNLSERCVEVYRRATGTSETGYATCEVLLEHDGIRLELDGTECGTVSVAALLP